MNDASPDSISDLLAAVERDEPGAFDQLIAAIYPELKRIAHFQLLGERADHTLNTTAIVHEAFLRLAGGRAQWADHAHFLRAASKVMRHLLVDHARQRNAKKRGDGVRAMTLEDALLADGDDYLAVLQLESALEDIRNIDPVLEEIIECRFFAGLSVSETADALGSSVRTIERQWQRARGYLLSAMDVEHK